MPKTNNYFTMQFILFFSLILASNSLYQLCPNGYFFDIQHCQTCQTNCKCSSIGTCDSCVDGYTFYNNQCIQCPQASGAIYGQCSGCCSKSTGTILACTDCATVVNKYSFLYSGRCILSEGCFQIDSKGFCTECRDGFYQTNNLCYACDSSCATCTDISNCITCANGYYWGVANGGLCISCPNGCSTCDNTDICYSCLDFYYLYTNHCLSCPTSCTTCIDGSTCTSCSVGILVSNLCLQCTNSIYGGSVGCLTCQQNNNFIKCTGCDDTYYLDSSSGTCRLCSSSIIGAIRCRDSSTPTQCQNDHDVVLTNRYYLVGISCIANTKSCKKISDINGNCALCYENYILSVNTCVPCAYTGCVLSSSSVVSNVCTCTSCVSGYYLPVASVVCSPCSLAHCSVCPSNTCTTCVSNYYLNGGVCTNSPISFCLVSLDATNCQTCIDGYYKGTNSQCYQCQNNCLICTTRFTCTKCGTGFYLSSNNHCVSIPTNCQKFDLVSKTCTLCSYGYYLFNGFCLQCSVQLGTLQNCQGLCPIDYYIQQLLSITTQFERITASFLSVALLLMLLLI